MPHRELKDPLYAQFARIGHAVSAPKRIELLDLLSQAERTVEQLAELSSTPVKNTSATSGCSGRRASSTHRAQQGLPDWRAAGGAVAQGA